MNATDAWAAAAKADGSNAVERIGSTILDRVLGNANARMVYGEPVQHGDRTVIPVARVSTRFGFGGGGGESTAGGGPSSGSGSGGGGMVDAKPIGYIEINAYGTEFHEIQDTTQIAMAGIRIAMVVAILVLLRILFFRRRRRKEKKAEAEVVTVVARRGRRRRRAQQAEAIAEPTASRVRRWAARAQ